MVPRQLEDRVDRRLREFQLTSPLKLSGGVHR